jgi:hypothetical protein
MKPPLARGQDSWAKVGQDSLEGWRAAGQTSNDLALSWWQCEQLAGDVIRVAAEGRKFGLYLLVVTQRPGKIDGSILSESDNVLLMKMSSAEDIKHAKTVFGFLSDAAVVSASTLVVGETFLQGRVL